MNPLLERFHAIIPRWYERIRKDTAREVERTPLTQECASGKLTALRSLVLHFWPFVDVYPTQIAEAGRRLLDEKYQARYGREHLLGLWGVVSEELVRMRREETAHRTLWILTAANLGVAEAELASKQPTPGVVKIIQIMGEAVEPTVTLSRFLAVEIVAESLSATLLASPGFKAALPPAGRQWFRAHVEHERGMTHEELVLRLALALDETADEQGFGAVVLHATSQFTAAADECSVRVV